MDSSDNDYARLYIPSESGPSRRAIIRAAGALTIAGTAFRAIPASAATASGTLPASAEAKAAAGARVPGFAGANKATFAAMLQKHTPATPPTGMRVYLDAVTFPNTAGYAKTSWPDITAEFSSPAHAVVSIRPDVDMLNAGKFDAELYAFMSSAPKGPASLLTMWHECATYTHSIAAYPKDPKAFRAGLARLRRVAAGEVSINGVVHKMPSTDIKVGVIDINPTYLNQNKFYRNDKPGTAYKLWMAPNLDWYGCDLYDNRKLDLSAYHELSLFREYINTLPGSHPNADWPVNLPEINSRVDPENPHNSTVRTTGPTGFRRSDFFHYAWSWLQRFGPGGHSTGLLGFWVNSGGEGSTWPPENTPAGSLPAMIAELNRENAQSKP